MARINPTQSHTLSIKDAKECLAAMFSELSSMGLEHRWDGDALILNASGLEGVAKVSAQSIDVELKLGLARSLVKGQIEPSLWSKLEKSFGS